MELLIDLNSDCPIYEQIYEFIKNEIKNGHILPDTKLPSTRSLAQSLKISRTTVVNAYEQLLAEGYLKSRGGSGYIVNRLDVLNIERKKYKRETKRKDFRIEDDIKIEESTQRVFLTHPGEVLQERCFQVKRKMFLLQEISRESSDLELR